MNRSDFIQMMHDAVRVDRQMLTEVRDLVGLFPYFQSAHLLLLKGLYRTEDIKFGNQLSQSAIHIADREVLYYLLNRKSIETTEEQPVKEIVEEQAQFAEDSQQVVIESGMSSADMIAEMDTVIMPEGSDSGSHEITTAEIEPIIIAADSETDESASVVLIIDDGEHHIEETVIYMDPSFMLNEQVDLLELDLDEGRSTEDVTNPEFSELTLPGNTNGRKTDQAELIDRFILANPRIGPVTDRSEKPLEDISKQFVEDTGGLVTETLAKIYVTQGYYSKAIDIYERLSLKYPEKSSYFASQIENIREFIK